MGTTAAPTPAGVDLEPSAGGPGFWDILLRRTATHGKLRGLLNSWLAHSMEEDERGARGGWSREPSSSGIYDAAPATDAPLSMAFEPEHSLVVREVISAQRLQGGGGGGGVHPPAPRDGAQDDDASASQLAAASSEAASSEAGASEAAPTATASSSTGEIEEALSGNVTRRSSPNIDAGSRSSSAPSLDSGRGLDGADAWSWRRTKSNSELLHALASKLEQQAADAAARVEAAAPGPADDAADDDYSSASPASVTASHAPAPPAPPAAAAADAFDVEATPTTDEVMGRDDDSAGGGGGSDDDDDDDDDDGGGGGGGGRCRAKAAPAPPAAAEEAASPRPSGFVARRNSSTARLHEQAQAPPSPEAAGAAPPSPKGLERAVSSPACLDGKPRVCSECEAPIAGALFMLNDNAYCCQRHRLVAYHKFERDVIRSRSLGVAEQSPAGLAPTGVRASFRAWI